MLYFNTIPDQMLGSIYQISKNKIDLNDNSLSLSIGQRSLNYQNLRLESTYTKLSEDNEYPQLEVFFLIDEKVTKTTREVYTVLDALSSTGGFLEILSIIAMTILGSLQEKLFYSSIISKLFREEVPEEKRVFDHKSSP